MEHDESRTEESVPAALYSPPSHPASNGEVWTGETCPTPSLLAEALSAKTVGSVALDKPRNG